VEVAANTSLESKRKIFKRHSGGASRQSYQHYRRVVADASLLLLQREVIFQQVCSRFIFVVVVAANASHGKEGIKAIEFI
jgi:hypothetical protein